MIDLSASTAQRCGRMPLMPPRSCTVHSTFPGARLLRRVQYRHELGSRTRLGHCFEPNEDGGAVWVIPATAVDPARPEEIEAVDPLDVVRTGPIVDLVGFPSRPPQPIRSAHWPRRRARGRRAPILRARPR